MKINRIYNLDCRKGLSKLGDNSIDCCISSPPYWSLRDYGIDPSIWDADHNCDHEFEEIIENQEGYNNTGRRWQHGVTRNDEPENWNKSIRSYSFCLKCDAWKGCLGLEPNFELFIKHLCDIYDEIKRVLKKTGTCWVNLGDIYSAGGRSGSKKYFVKGHKQFGRNEPKGKYQAPLKVRGFKPKCLLMLPSRFAIEMINRGWILRNVIIWHKPNAMPSSARDRFTVDFEYVFLFVKNEKYWFDQIAIREKSNTKVVYSRNSKKGGIQAKNNPHSNWGMTRKELKEKGLKKMPDMMRNKRCVWTINTKPNPAYHFATFPADLVKPMIKAGCPQFICKKCGKPRERITNYNYIPINQLPKDHKAYRPSPGYIGNKRLNIDTKVQPNMATYKYGTALKIPKSYAWTDCGCDAGWTGGLVLDPFAGTGTTLLEAFKLGRDYIGFEISPEYTRIAREILSSTNYIRIDNFMNENKLKKREVD